MKRKGKEQEMKENNKKSKKYVFLFISIALIYLALISIIFLIYSLNNDTDESLMASTNDGKLKRIFGFSTSGSDSNALQGSTGYNNKIYFATSKSGSNNQQNYYSKIKLYDIKTKKMYTLTDFNKVLSKMSTYKINDITTNETSGRNYYLLYDAANENNSKIMFSQYNIIRKLTLDRKFTNIAYNKDDKKYYSLTSDGIYNYEISNISKNNTNENVGNVKSSLACNIQKKEGTTIQGITINNNLLFKSYHKLLDGKDYVNYIDVYDINDCKNNKTIKTYKTYKLGKCSRNSTIRNCAIGSLFYMNSKLYIGYNNSNFKGINFYTSNISTKNNNIDKTAKKRAQKVSISKKNLSLVDEQSAILTATVTPENASNKKVIWSSSNTKVATVDASGKVRAKGVGTAKITATSSDNSRAKATCIVKVRAIKILMAGNSKTGSNGIPKKFINIAKNRGYTVTVKYFKDNYGKSLSTLYKNHKDDYLNKYAYDYVIMQEKTSLYSKDYSKEKSFDFYDGVEKIREAAISKNPNVKLFVRKTWIYSNSSTSVINRSYENANLVVKNLNSYLKNSSHKPKYTATIINDGPSMYDARKSLKNNKIYVFRDDKNDPDDHTHQSNEGAYLTASCIYATVFKKDPTKITYYPSTEINKSTAKKLRNIAKKYCFSESD